MREATSPACAPPMPSATTNSGERASSESSLARRWRPVSLPAYCSATRSTSVDLERELAVADAHPVAGVQRPGALQQLLVEVGAVGRAEIFDHDDVALLVDTGVARGGKRVLEPDLGAVAAAQHDVAVEVVDHAGIVAGGAIDHEPRRAIDERDAAERRGGVHAGGILRDRLARFVEARGDSFALGRGAPAKVAPRAARDPQQKQVDDDHEAELQGDGHRRERAHETSKTISVEPSSTRSPGASACAPRTSAPLTRTPLVEPRSATVQPSDPGRISAWRRETPASSSTTSQSRLRPFVPPLLGTNSRRPPTASNARGGVRRTCASSTGPRSRSELLKIIVSPRCTGCCGAGAGAGAGAARCSGGSAGGRDRRAWMPNSPNDRRSSV